MGKPKVNAGAVMADIERDVRERLRRHLLKRGGAADYDDARLFDDVHGLLTRAVEGRNPEAMLLPELLDADDEPRLQLHLSLSSHRPALGRAIVFVKRAVLLPLTRWLFEYSQDNFRRQDRLNRILFACIEELALENAKLRAELSHGGAHENTQHESTKTRKHEDTKTVG